MWVKLDDRFDEHRKVVDAGPLGMALYVAGLCYSNRNATDGHIPRGQVGRLIDLDGILVPNGPNGIDETRPHDVAEALVDVGLWEHADGGGYRIHDYLKFQPSREQVMAEQDELREKRRRAGKARAAQARRGKAGRFTPVENGGGETPPTSTFQSAGDDPSSMSESAGESAGQTNAEKPQVTPAKPAPPPAPDQHPTSRASSPVSRSTSLLHPPGVVTAREEPGEPEEEDEETEGENPDTHGWPERLVHAAINHDAQRALDVAIEHGQPIDHPEGWKRWWIRENVDDQRRKTLTDLALTAPSHYQPPDLLDLERRHTKLETDKAMARAHVEKFLDTYETETDARNELNAMWPDQTRIINAGLTRYRQLTDQEGTDE